MIRAAAGWHPERRKGPVLYRYGICPLCRLETLGRRKWRPSAFRALTGWAPDRPVR